jgi:tetratricopeptide (TPR) repeat protein
MRPIPDIPEQAYVSRSTQFAVPRILFLRILPFLRVAAIAATLVWFGSSRVVVFAEERAPDNVDDQALAQALARADRLHASEHHTAARYLLSGILEETPGGTDPSGVPDPHGPVRPEILWRLSRAIMNETSLLYAQEAISRSEAQRQLLRAEDCARSALEYTPDCPHANFWLASSMGMRGNIEGAMSSFRLSRPLRDLLENVIVAAPENAEAYYILARLYHELPGKPISYGNADHAVSYGRYAADLHTRQYDSGQVPVRYHDLDIQLARQLWDRNYSADRRARRRAAAGNEKDTDTGRKTGTRRINGETANDSGSRTEATTDPRQRAAEYDRSAAPPDLSDREEAVRILDSVIRYLERLQDRSVRNVTDLKNAREIRAGFQ